MRCTARRTQASEPTLTAFLRSGGGETCRVNSSWYFVLHNMTDCCCWCCCCAAAAVVYEYVSTERCAPRALLLVPKPAPADCCSGHGEMRPPLTARRARSNDAIQLCHHPTHRSFCCCLLSWRTYWIQRASHFSIRKADHPSRRMLCLL